MLSFRLSGVFLFRFAERTLFGWLLQDPPRHTRLDGRRPLEGQFTKQSGPQSIGVGVAGVAKPAQQTLLDVWKRIQSQPTTHPNHVAASALNGSRPLYHANRLRAGRTARFQPSLFEFVVDFASPSDWPNCEF